MQDLNQMQAYLSQFDPSISFEKSESRLSMIAYSATKQQFVDVVRANAIAEFIEGEVTSKDAILNTNFQHGEQETNLLSYQAWSYGALIEDYNEIVCINKRRKNFYV